MSLVLKRALAVRAITLPLAWASSGGPRPARGDENPPAAKATEHLEARVAPLLAKHCLECHGPASRKGGLDLSRKKAALARGKNGNAVVPGKPGESLLWEHVESGAMPPKSRPPPSAADRRLLNDWIAGGAVWPDTVADISRFAPDRNAESAWVRRLTVPEYVETVRAAVGVNVEREARELLPRDLRADGFGNTAYNLTVDLAHVEGYAKLAEIAARRVDVLAFAAMFTPKRDLTDDNLRALVAAIGKRLLRGPLDGREVNSFLNVAHPVKKEGGDFAEVVRYLVEAMLQSPRFLYRIENQDTGHARASRLSYILWGAPPDDELTRAADAGELSDRGKLAAQVRRMLKDPRAVAQSRRFVSEWLNFDRLAQFYNTARCCPTRASLLTGLYPYQAGIGHMVADDRLPAYRGFLSDL